MKRIYWSIDNCWCRVNLTTSDKDLYLIDNDRYSGDQGWCLVYHLVSGVHNFRLSTWKELESQFMPFCNPWSNSSTFCQSEKFIAGIGQKKGPECIWVLHFLLSKWKELGYWNWVFLESLLKLVDFFPKEKKCLPTFRAKDILIEKRERGLSVYFYLER